jgi:hypothetical protein
MLYIYRIFTEISKNLSRQIPMAKLELQFLDEVAKAILNNALKPYMMLV